MLGLSNTDVGSSDSISAARAKISVPPWSAPDDAEVPPHPHTSSITASSAAVAVAVALVT